MVLFGEEAHPVERNDHLIINIEHNVYSADDQVSTKIPRNNNSIAVHGYG